MKAKSENLFRFFSFEKQPAIKYQNVLFDQSVDLTALTVIQLQFWAYRSWDSLFPISVSPTANLSGLENSTRPLVFTSASGCRASENFDISSEN